MNANALALGRNHSLADAVSITTFSDCARVDIRWDDGGHVSCLYGEEDGDFKALALAHVRNLGWG
jgi:hypothetical protein